MFPSLQNEDMQQQIIKETFQLVSKRDDNVCNFLEGGRLVTVLHFYFNIDSICEECFDYCTSLSV